MKTLKIVIALFIIFGLATNNVNAQKPVRQVITQHVILYFPCLEQYLIGDPVFEINIMNNHFQSKISGTLTGEDGIEYSIDAMEEAKFPNWSNWGRIAIPIAWIQWNRIRQDGKLIGSIGFAYHFTVNANGVVVVEVGTDYKVICH